MEDIDTYVVPFLACAAILYASVWFVHSRRGAYTPKKSPVTSTSKTSPLNAKTVPFPTTTTNHSTTKNNTSIVDSSATSSVNPTSNVWVVEDQQQKAETRRVFAGQRLALLYCCLRNSEALIAQSKLIKSSEPWTQAWSKLFLKKEKKTPAPFSLPKALSLRKNKLIDLCNCYLKVTSEQQINQFLGRVVSRSKVSSKELLTDAEGVEYLSKIFDKESHDEYRQQLKQQTPPVDILPLSSVASSSPVAVDIGITSTKKETENVTGQKKQQSEKSETSETLETSVTLKKSETPQQPQQPKQPKQPEQTISKEQLVVQKVHTTTESTDNTKELESSDFLNVNSVVRSRKGRKKKRKKKNPTQETKETESSKDARTNQASSSNQVSKTSTETAETTQTTQTTKSILPVTKTTNLINSTKADHTYDKGYKKWETFDVEAELGNIDKKDATVIHPTTMSTMEDDGDDLLDSLLLDAMDDSLKEMCAQCNNGPKQGEKLRKCTGCSSEQYCSRECQKKHWKLHKKVCKSLTSMGSSSGSAATLPAATPATSEKPPITPEEADLDDILGNLLNEESEDDDLDALLDEHLEETNDDKINVSVDLDDMLNDMLDSDEDNDAGIGLNDGITGVTDPKELTALRLLQTVEERQRWCTVLKKDQIRQSTMPPSKPPSRMLSSLLPIKSRTRQMTEKSQQQVHKSDDIFGMVLGRAMVQGGLAKRGGGAVQLSMSQYELEELKRDYQDVFREEVRKRLTRDTDFDGKRFQNSSQQFM